MVVINYLQVVLRSGCSGGPGSATRIIVIIQFLYVCVYVSLCNSLDTGGMLCVHKTFRRRSMTAHGRLVCFQHIRPMPWKSDFIFKLFLSFSLKVDLD